MWRICSNTTLFRDAGLPSRRATVEEARLRLAFRLKTMDNKHPIAERAVRAIRRAGVPTGTPKRPASKIQQVDMLLPHIPTPILTSSHYSHGCRRDPTEGKDKEEASKAFKEWWNLLSDTDLTISSDGSEQTVDQQHKVGYGYAIYRGQKKIATGCGAISSQSHVCDAGTIGEWRGLRKALKLFLEQDHRQHFSHLGHAWQRIYIITVGIP